MGNYLDASCLGKIQSIAIDIQRPKVKGGKLCVQGHETLFRELMKSHWDFTRDLPLLVSIRLVFDFEAARIPYEDLSGEKHSTKKTREISHEDLSKALASDKHGFHHVGPESFCLSGLETFSEEPLACLCDRQGSEIVFPEWVEVIECLARHDINEVLGCIIDVRMVMNVCGPHL
ncbi:hypothetical protein RRF57_010659 [Xylaria bambusicola]|uniref:Uncharacterized protein n=1 Tax=Xylaria bambusicola TaxID=326684 RepID=A0AAN7USS5_9PEZI